MHFDIHFSMHFDIHFNMYFDIHFNVHFDTHLDMHFNIHLNNTNNIHFLRFFCVCRIFFVILRPILCINKKSSLDVAESIIHSIVVRFVYELW